MIILFFLFVTVMFIGIAIWIYCNVNLDFYCSGWEIFGIGLFSLGFTMAGVFGALLLEKCG